MQQNDECLHLLRLFRHVIEDESSEWIATPTKSVKCMPRRESVSSDKVCGDVWIDVLRTAINHRRIECVWFYQMKPTAVPIHRTAGALVIYRLLFVGLPSLSYTQMQSVHRPAFA